MTARDTTVAELFPNVDAWGAKEWFARLVNAIENQDRCVVDGDDLGASMWRNIASSSSMRLAREFSGEITAALTAAGHRIIGPADMEAAVVYPGLSDAVERLREAASRDSAISITVRAQDLRNVLSALTAASPHMPVPDGLVEFAKEMCRIGFDGGSIDGCDILDTAVEHGLCTVAQYHPRMTGIANREYLEEGDAVYVFSGPLASRPNGGA